MSTVAESAAPRDPGITWHYVSAHLPPVYRDILLAVTGESEAAEGFRAEQGAWWFSTGHEVHGTVYAWAHLPALPPQKGGAA